MSRFIVDWAVAGSGRCSHRWQKGDQIELDSIQWNFHSRVLRLARHSVRRRKRLRYVPGSNSSSFVDAGKDWTPGIPSHVNNTFPRSISSEYVLDCKGKDLTSSNMLGPCHSD